MDNAYDDKKERVTAEIMLEDRASSTEEARRRSQDYATNQSLNNPTAAAQPQFRLYRRRFSGVVSIVILSIVAGMNLPWFGPIANNTSQTFGITLDQVNWLGNIVGCTYLVVAPLVPVLSSRFGLRSCYLGGTAFLILSAWVRFAGTARSLSPQGAYALLIIGQFLSAIPQVVFQVLAPKFSETWFDLKGRTTATMLMAISNPVGNALGQLISPMFSNVRSSVLVLGIICTAVSPFVLLIGSKPPAPPSYSGSQPSHAFLTTLRAIFGLLPRPLHHSNEARRDTDLELVSPVSKVNSLAERVAAFTLPSGTDVTRGEDSLGPGMASHEFEEEAYMTLRERVDFIILTIVFSVLVSSVNTFSLLSNEILEPYGYSDDIAGLMGATLLLSGLVAAFLTSPIFDRVLTHHLGLAARIFVPIIAAAWLSLIWAARPNNTGALFAIFAVIGVFEISLLPVGLELGVELTRNSGSSSAILWFSANLASIVFILVMSALRAPSTASPPLNMHRSLIFNGASVCAGAVFIFLFRGHQRRREKDARVAADASAAANSSAGGREESVSQEQAGRRKGRRWIDFGERR